MPVIVACFCFLEMRPRWFQHSEVPFDSMWPADYLWYPILLDNGYLDAFIKFEGHNKLLDYSITRKNKAIGDSCEK